MQNALKFGAAPRRAVGAPYGEVEQRIAERFTLLIRAAKLVTDSGEFLCVIRDVSETGISVRIFHRLPDTHRIFVELQNGDGYEVDLVWQDEDRAGFRFADDVNIMRIIEMPSSFTKRAIRLNLAARASVVTLEGRSEIVEITDLSQQGAKITCSCQFAIDERVKISADGLPETYAKVRWRKDGSCGLIFEDTYQYGDLARIAEHLQRAG
ncbi:PilZ domain-containing protein [Aurantiacibacter rhizosphaerae]|uniref:PilZ domain-containing protein n=1 Tax=Aurantiacibacter rhizosphaerae TaxID=2691582 RepID=A0A844XA16_9SPHN|nr:PilZ domain-containing protein [Aurantiacibacter rhizosphaerae]MWV26488.1 PilZ domain-containing protein [Aurantiacibacter rhizosphaerae]